MTTKAEDLRTRFWRDAAEKGDASLDLIETVAVHRRGPGARNLYDLATLRLNGSSETVLLAYLPRVQPAALERIGPRITRVAKASAHKRADRRTPSPIIVTERASRRLVQAGRDANIGIIDLAGTMDLRLRHLLIQVSAPSTGKSTKPAQSVQVFDGAAVRIVRFLLNNADAIDGYASMAGADVAAQVGLSYAYAYRVLRALESEGYVGRRSPRTGFFLKDAGGLLRAWMAAGRPTAVAVEGFFAPKTTSTSLAHAAEALNRETQKPLFTMTAGLEEEEKFVSGVPYAVYWDGPLQPVVEAFALKPMTPHNFLVLRPDPSSVGATAGTLQDRTRTLPWGDGVSLPQLAVDFHNGPGRGKEQAKKLLERFDAAVPTIEEDS